MEVSLIKRVLRASRCRIWPVALCLSVLSVPALASQITFHFTGTVTQTNFDPSDPFGGSIGFGTAITGSYTFDSATPDSDPSVSSASYQHAGPPYGLSINIGGNLFSTNDFLAVNVLNGAGIDQYGVLACNGGSAACFSGDLTVSMLMQDATGTALASAALPVAPPPVAAFPSRTLSLYRNYFDDAGTFYQIQIDGTLDSLTAVPEPSTTTSLLLGCALFAIARRKAKLKTS